ncbi:MAG TPA: DUF1592 domain-containing protein [Gemmata sp.]|nr:DUF1592 domain-containing protein [Gemmata sp.]
MSRSSGTRVLRIVFACGLSSLGSWGAFHALLESGTNEDPLKKDSPRPPSDSLDARFSTQVKPFLERYCFSCHGPKKQAASLDLSRDLTVPGIVKNAQQWELVIERLHANEMPPEDAKLRPEAKERTAAIEWIREVRAREAERNAGDPGTVLARRLSNAEYDNSIRDVTGIDIRPTREFPVDPANQSGFDNSGESLAMSPALLKKYLAAARHIADHIVLKPEGFVFAPHPAVTDTDRDKYCVQRIIDFYKRYQIDYANYFLAAWKYHHRELLGRGKEELSQFATEAGLSPKYLSLVWSALVEPEAEVGPLVALRKLWSGLPLPDKAKPDVARPGCERMRNLVVQLRKPLKPTLPKLHVNGISDGSQPLVLARNRQLASKHQEYAGDVPVDFPKLIVQLKPGELGLTDLFAVKKGDAEAERRGRAALVRFCEVFPAAFFVADRGPYFDPNAVNQGRPLTAGFHLMQGYFRDDQPLYTLILDKRDQAELDALWQELNFITGVPIRQYKDFIFFERAEPPRFIGEAAFDFARSEDKDAISEAKMNKLAEAYIAKARKQKASDEAIGAIQTYFANMSADIRWVEATHLKAESSHLDTLLKVAERAYRRPLTVAERDGLLAFYRTLRQKDELGHEEAIRDTFAAVLLSPHFCYRFDLAAPGASVRSLTDYELASRLSYFLWSSMPDAELLSHAAAGDLHKPETLKAQTKRMLQDARVRGLATEFGGNWLDFRRFEEHNSVDRERFPQFTNELRQAMFEEPVRYLVDVANRNRSVLDLLYGKDTFVNRTLAKHYGMSEVRGTAEEWIHIEDAERYGRGGLLPMSVFLTKNAPGLRTSPVKRGYWVVRSLLGERIPPPPPTVPELPKDEAKLGDLTLPQVLASHRADKSCAGCHNRFDAVGLVFEGFGPVGERRTKDLGGKPVEIAALFPDGGERKGMDGLRDYLRNKRQNDFVDNLCRKLLSYALGRSLQLSDQKALDEMRAKLIADKYAFGSMVESIVLSTQFLNKRGKDDPRE